MLSNSDLARPVTCSRASMVSCVCCALAVCRARLSIRSNARFRISRCIRSPVFICLSPFVFPIGVDFPIPNRRSHNPVCFIVPNRQRTTADERFLDQSSIVSSGFSISCEDVSRPFISQYFCGEKHLGKEFRVQRFRVPAFP